MEDNDEASKLKCLRAVELVRMYFDNRPFKEGAAVNELQSAYDHCMEIMETVTMREIDLLWKLRRLPYFFDKMIDKFIEDNLSWWKFNEPNKQLNDLLKFGRKPEDK
ncbi:MAG: hypothetical protein K2M36_03830 [Clostridia bacterium]|nr:hypothetical protein [Clostridia bacterium]